jgi:AraC family transcriptional regulator of adaptative response / DNA-3-methyladenine glycosylase II
MKLKSLSSGRLSPERMYALLLASDPTYNGRFFTGVLTTGIYCLPSCKARKPKREHVRFFPNVQAARAAGLRPCKKCYPDDFARGADPVLESFEMLVAEMRADPAAFPDTAAIVRRSGFGATRLFELFRLHYHATPAELLLRARLDWAKQKLLAGNSTLDTIAADAGFDALSAFHENFRLRTGLTPAGYRQLRSTREFELRLPPGYPLPYLRRALSRDSASVIERLTGNVYTAAVRLEAGPALLMLRLSPAVVRAEVSHGSAVEAHALVAGLLGLGQDAAGFARLARRLGLARLTHGREELRVSQTHSVWDGLLWSIIGQQINFAFACVLRRRLTERAGTAINGGLCALPDAAAVANLSRADLLKLQFSRQKADYTLALAHAVLEGKLKPDALRRASATRAERTLLGVHGFGPWSVHYVMMRSLGFADCVPLGDTGISSGLQALLNLDERPEIAAVRQLMAVFSPYRSLATAHLWQFKQSLPE